jgi:hypothetical protein
MGKLINPALVRFLDAMGDGMVVAQVHLARQTPEGFVLRHVADAREETGELKDVAVGALRELVQKNAEGGFRPLSASPDLPRGWRCTARSAEELEQALESVYPGFLADWHAVREGTAVPTDYYPFTQRQSGMYRLTAKATPEQAGAIVQACCAPRFCLKQRLWTVPDLAPDRQEDKSLIPCLEPCALLLEFARKRMRISQETTVTLTLAATEIRGLLAAVEAALHRPDPHLRVADFNAPANSRHLEWLRQRLFSALPSSAVGAAPVAERETD